MKKLFAFLLAGIIVLSLFACGNDQGQSVDVTEAQNGEDAAEAVLSKEEMLKIAETTTIRQMRADAISNSARASTVYTGNAFLIWGKVDEIKAEYIELTFAGGRDWYVRAYLPTESIMSLNTNDVIQIVGVVDEIDDENSVFVMKNASFVTDNYEVTEARITGAVFELNDDINFTVEDENFGEVHLIYRLPHDDRWLAYSSEYPNYTLSASGKMTWDSSEHFQFQLHCSSATYKERK